MPKAEMAQEKFCCCAKRKPIELYPLADGRRVAFPRRSESSGIGRADACQLSDTVHKKYYLPPPLHRAEQGLSLRWIRRVPTTSCDRELDQGQEETANS